MERIGAQQWVENYLYSALEHCVLEQSILAEGDRRGYSERELRRAARKLNVVIVAGRWELPALRVEAIEIRNALSGGTPVTGPVKRRVLPQVATIDERTRARFRRIPRGRE